MEKSRGKSPETLGEKVKKWSGRIGIGLGVTLMGGAVCSGLTEWMDSVGDEPRTIRLLEKELKPQMDAIRDACRRVLKGRSNDLFMPEDCELLKLNFYDRTNHID